MESRRLELFLAAVRTGSLSKASAEVGCTQSAATQAMNSLENELGCILLERRHDGVRLTEAGKQLLPTARRALASMERLGAQAQSLAAGQAPPIRIDCFASIATTWLPSMMMGFQQIDPRATFEVHVGTSSLAEGLLTGRTDLALGDVEWLRAFSCIPLMEDEFLAVVPARYLDDYPWLGEGGRVTREQLFELPSLMAPMNDLERHFTKLQDRSIHIACDDDSALVALVARGLGVAVVPGLSLRDFSPSVRVFDIDPAPKRTLGVALSDQPTQSAARFAEYLKANVPLWREAGSTDVFR